MHFLRKKTYGVKGMNTKRMERLFFELEAYYRQGISLWVENSNVSPIELISCNLVQEESEYMRDYITDERGVVESIHFDKIDRQE